LLRVPPEVPVRRGSGSRSPFFLSRCHRRTPPGRKAPAGHVSGRALSTTDSSSVSASRAWFVRSITAQATQPPPPRTSGLPGGSVPRIGRSVFAPPPVPERRTLSHLRIGRYTYGGARSLSSPTGPEWRYPSFGCVPARGRSETIRAHR